MATVQQHREFFAQWLVRNAGGAGERLIDAFTRVAREDYVGAGPWQVAAGRGYIRTSDADPRWLYQDILIGLKPERHVNNGQPSLHARCMVEADPAPGESVVHIGAGTGYYTAILSCLVGPRGRVAAFEIDAELARRAAQNLAARENVELRCASASTATLPACDVIYVSAGVTDFPSAWLDAMAVGGRMLVPLTPDDGFGVVLKVQRQAPDRYAAQACVRAGFTPCIGARDASTSRSLAFALDNRPPHRIRSLRRRGAPDATAWCVGQGWWLSMA